jgi:protein involved in polysaccharide export with SLBB domain
LGTYGQVFVAGMNLKEAKTAIDKHLAAFLDRPDAEVSVFAYNSKVYYVILEDPKGDTATRLPITGNETVLDALAQVDGFKATSKKKIWIARPQGGGSCDTILPVDWKAITAGAATTSNYQLLPGDRIFIADDEAKAHLMGWPVPGKDRLFTSQPPEAILTPSSSAPSAPDRH